MNLTTILYEVRTRLGELAEDFFDDDEVLLAVNDGLRRFTAEERWPWLYTEVSSGVSEADTSLVLPTNVAVSRVFNLAITEQDGTALMAPEILERVDPSAGFRLRFANAAAGKPRRYYLTAVSESDAASDQEWTVRLIPESDAEYTVEYQYFRVPEPLATGADVPDLPEEYHEAIPAWAAGKLFLKEFSISKKAQEQFELYTNVVQQAREEMFSPTEDEVVAWGREHPGESIFMNENEYVNSRLNGPLGP